MKPHHYLAIFVRLFAVALFILTIKQSSYFFQWIFFDGIEGIEAPIFQIILSIIMPLFISIILWFFPVIVAKSILKPEINQNIEPTDKMSIFFVAISIIGLFTTFYALIDTFYYFTLWQVVNSPDNYNDIYRFFPADVKANIWATGIELLLGLLLIFKSKTIARKIFEIAN
ncbi:MAG: hypothetical protein ACRBCI_14255 [Cellvibrionaceae bacterium]